jgi:bifunctional non-homologous end joining protein LigD
MPFLIIMRQLLWCGGISVNSTPVRQQSDCCSHMPSVRFPPKNDVTDCGGNVGLWETDNAVRMAVLGRVAVRLEMLALGPKLCPDVSMAENQLKKYRSKRDFTRTAEPYGTDGADGSRFVVHKHHATADHYDLRLELGGVLKSWAVPKGPSLNPDDKRLAVATEDHPIDYLDFEGVIPAGEYGGGPMIVWDTGTWAPMGNPETDIEKGSFKFRLAGEKLGGGWMLTRLKSRPEDKGKSNWLLFKERDQAMDIEADILETRPESVKTGRRIEELMESQKPASRKRRVPSLKPESYEFVELDRPRSEIAKSAQVTD